MPIPARHRGAGGLLLAAAMLAVLPAQAPAQDWATRCRQEAGRGLTAACQKALEASPRDPEMHALLGQAYFAGGFYGEGLQSLREAIDTSGGAPDYRYRFAGFAALINEFAQASDELEKVVAARPKDAKAWSLLADCYRFMKNGPQSLRATRRAAELGDAAEAYALAARYAEGDGIARDNREERRWLERAARGGYVAAMQDLAAFYAAGRPGIPPDPAKQHYWEDAARKATD